MASRSRSFNPFYPVVVLAGIAFCVTACAYGVMTFRALRGPTTDQDRTSSLIQFLDRNGERLLLAEVLILGVATVAAIGSDSYWRRGALIESRENEVD